MNKFVLLFLFSVSSFAADRVLHVVLVRTADTDGNKASTATAASFKTQVEHANAIWAGTGIRFVFDPVADFPPMVKDTLLNHDWMLLPGQSLGQSKDKEPQTTGTLFAQAKNDFVRKNYWGKLVVFAGVGDQLNFNDALGKWQIDPRTYAYGDMWDMYVQWFQGDASPNVFAHEVGHYLHLYHTHGALPKNKTELTNLVNQAISQWGYTQNNVATYFDGDASVVSDTPPDPGPELWKDVTGDACSAVNQITVAGVVFSTDRRDIMSYFKECPFPEGFHVSAQQAQRSRESLDFGNRQYLLNQNPGFLIPQLSPDIKAVSWAPGRLDLFASGADLRTVHKAYDPSIGWVPAMQYGAEQWDNMGGKIVGKPAAVAWGPNRLDVFVRGTDNAIYHKAWNGSAWFPGAGVSDWENIGGVIAGSPVAVSWGKERLDIFGAGYDGQLHHKWWSPQSGWGPSVAGWEAIGGKVSVNPVVTSWAPGRLDVIIRGYDGAIYHKAFVNNTWYPSLTDWDSLGGSTIGEPSIVSWSANRLDMVVRGTDNQVYHKAWAGNAWYPSQTGWNSLGGIIMSKPSMVSWGPGRFDIVAAGSDTQIYSKSYQEGSGWYPSQSGWYSLGGWILPGSNPEVVSWKSGRLDIFIRNSNFAIQHKAYDSQSGWYPGLTGLWEDLGKYVE